jgi:fermentation-respiration switch protein FrsA (DUF1100 family)
MVPISLARMARRTVSIFMAAALAAGAVAQSPRAEEAFAGIWAGELAVQNLSLRLVFTISLESGRAKASLDSPDQGATGLPVASVSISGAKVDLEMPAFGARYEGTLSPDGARIEGSWEQGGMKLPLVLAKRDRPIVLDRPQEPRPPFPYTSTEMSIRNEKAGITLAGSLLVPEGAGPFPAVVLVSGSGAQNRDEELLGHKPFLVLADHLARRGIASLRYDDRGVEKSEGDFSASTSYDFADDAEAALEALSARSEVAKGRIGIVGHSEGGLIAPIVAARNAKAAFIVLLAGPGLRGDELLLRQGALIARAAGASEEDIADAAGINAVLYAIAAGSADESAASAALKDAYLAWMTANARMGAEEKAAARAAVDKIVAPLASPWFRTFLGFDPAPYLARVTVPVLALNGSKDLQVPAAENLAAIERAIGERADPRNRYVELPGLNHLFQTATTGSPEEYGKIAETMAPEALGLIGDWIIGLW